jgi:hypothetical protein
MKAIVKEICETIVVLAVIAAITFCAVTGHC